MRTRDFEPKLSKLANGRLKEAHWNGSSKEQLEPGNPVDGARSWPWFRYLSGFLGLHRAKRTPEELSVFLRGLRDGTLTNRQWDEFECLPIKDPKLEAIRKEALAVRLPIDEGGRSKIAKLLTRLT
jgi:hypothetical protein